MPCNSLGAYEPWKRGPLGPDFCLATGCGFACQSENPATRPCLRAAKEKAAGTAHRLWRKGGRNRHGAPFDPAVKVYRSD